MARYGLPQLEVSEGVSRRFFAAVAALVELGRLGSLSGFCNEHGLSAPRYRAMRLAYGVTPKEGYKCPYHNVEVAALVALASNYPVSGGWLLTGRGSMLTIRK